MDTKIKIELKSAAWDSIILCLLWMSLALTNFKLGNQVIGALNIALSLAAAFKASKRYDLAKQTEEKNEQ